MDVSTPAWRKSSYSGGDGGNCVELGRLVDGVGVRDSKNLERGHLSVTPEQFAALLARIRHDQ